METTVIGKEFESFPKIPRLKRGCIITEKIDGSNAQICIGEDGTFQVGSRNRWLSDEKGKDNSNFCRWATENKTELLKLGPGRHFGEWWGQGIQRGYGLMEKRFSLFNPARWAQEGSNLPSCVSLVPVLYTGDFNDDAVNQTLETLSLKGSQAAPGFMSPEGIVVYHIASRTMFKVTLDNDAKPKGAIIETPMVEA